MSPQRPRPSGISSVKRSNMYVHVYVCQCLGMCMCVCVRICVKIFSLETWCCNAVGRGPLQRCLALSWWVLLVHVLTFRCVFIFSPARMQPNFLLAARDVYDSYCNNSLFVFLTQKVRKTPIENCIVLIIVSHISFSHRYNKKKNQWKDNCDGE